MTSLANRFYNEVFKPYQEILKSNYRFHPLFASAKKIWEEKLTFEELVNGPYLEKSQIYADGKSLDSLPLHEKTVATIKKRLSGRSLYKHQTDALDLLLSQKNAIIATGTSSGKTLCYQIPILDDLVRDPSPGLRAIIIYPLNALVNDQLREWDEMLKDHKGIKYARFTGQTPNNQSDYISRLKEFEKELLIAKGDCRTQQELDIDISKIIDEKLQNDLGNRLNHREDIRNNPPHVLITNFSMLEYLLERPIDAPIFEDARLKFLILDEVHAYRGVQATEIAFLIRRLKERLRLEKLTCIATSATLGKKDDSNSTGKVRRFASDIFGEDFTDQNPIYGSSKDLVLAHPSFSPTAQQYITAAEKLKNNMNADISSDLGRPFDASLTSLLSDDENIYRLHKDILNKPKLLKDAARELWPNDNKSEDGLLALLEIAGLAKKRDTGENLLSTRLHYFVKSQNGLHVCLHRECPDRHRDSPAFFVSRKNNSEAHEGDCPACSKAGRKSLLVETVTCRKCGYLFGALQELGPKRYHAKTEGDPCDAEPSFDSFSTELGWAGDSFWSYFSIDDELLPPDQATDEEIDDDVERGDSELDWCVVCGKKSDRGAGDNCKCQSPHLRKIKIFHRQCKINRHDNLSLQEKSLLSSCPNCGARNGSGLEPLRRFQESEDETGLSMAIPLSHFQVGAQMADTPPQRKLLCFTDHRQRAAAFPSLIEEETFSHDMGRKINDLIKKSKKAIKVVDLGLSLFEMSNDGYKNPHYDPDFFLPASRLPDDLPQDPRERKNIYKDLWIGETISYFGIPDSARESAEDLGLAAVEYQVNTQQRQMFYSILEPYALSAIDSETALQVLLNYLRQRKAFTLPNGVNAWDPAFGRVTAEITYMETKDGTNAIGWLPKTQRGNKIIDYLMRLLNVPRDTAESIAKKIWDFLISSQLLKENRRGGFQLYHEQIHIIKPETRFVCPRCSIVTAYSAKNCCPREGCNGKLEKKPFASDQENFIARWVEGSGTPQFKTLKSEEHTAQINKDLAKKIEDEFRIEGVNLLSSTTTFEMGINIGDLQKILLRNAPPTSANYVQRAGRAGRGEEKNSVCVTMCRQTKYDLDAWENPPRLMSGEIRTPAIFLHNKIIAQRHFNAIVFAKFLRIKIIDERALGTNPPQSIRMEPFLPIESLSKLPSNWLKAPDSHLDFPEWIANCKKNDVFETSNCDELLSNFENSKEKCGSGYKEFVAEIVHELEMLMEERKKLFNEGKGRESAEVGQSITNLLNSDIIAILAKRGFLPRYAFPLDVVTLETSKMPWSNDSDVELSRDRGIAIAEFAPGAQVIAHKKVFTSAGLFVLGKKDIPDFRWFSKCQACNQIRTAKLKGEIGEKCPVCQTKFNPLNIKQFVKPDAFSVRVDDGGQKRGEARYRRNTLIRQRQTLTHFIDSVDDSNFLENDCFKLAVKNDGMLFRYNLGPKGEGFNLCKNCGCSLDIKPGKPHKKLRFFSGSKNCENTNLAKKIAYGHEFQSYCLIIRPIRRPSSIESLAYALQKGLCGDLELETFDIGVSWRWLASRKSGNANGEIILYDNTPGGAGFVEDAKRNWGKIVENAHKVCNECKCEKACYDCLKNYGNQSYHENLDRNSVVNFFLQC